MKFLIFFILVLCVGFAKGQNASLTVISNPKGVPAELKMGELKSILMGERQRWASGRKVMIALMKTNTAVGKYTSEKLYNMSPDEVKKFWLALVFQGKADAPTFFNSVSDLQAYVAENPGAIGIIDQPLPGNSANVVTVDGRKSF